MLQMLHARWGNKIQRDLQLRRGFNPVQMSVVDCLLLLQHWSMFQSFTCFQSHNKYYWNVQARFLWRTFMSRKGGLERWITPGRFCVTAECQPSQNPAEQKWFSWADTPAPLLGCCASCWGWCYKRWLVLGLRWSTWACLVPSGENQGTSTLWFQGRKQRDPHSNPRDCSTEERILCVSMVVSETLPPPDDLAVVTMGKMLC